MVRTIAIAALCLVVASCGAKQKSAMSPPATQSHARDPGAAGAEPTQVMPAAPRSEIEQLWSQIEQERGTLGLAEPPPMAMPGAPQRMSTVPMSTDASCNPTKTERCTSSCTLSDSICKNADRICALALELPGDAWAADKCARAKQTCEAAHESCCSCR